MIKERNFWIYILLSIVTCGIYSIIFWYQYTEDINELCRGDGHESPNYIIVILLSIITCGIYGYIWYYSQANRLQAAADRYGTQVQGDGIVILLWLILGSFLCGLGIFVGIYMLINNMNIVARAYNGGGSSSTSKLQ